MVLNFDNYITVTSSRLILSAMNLALRIHYKWDFIPTDVTQSANNLMIVISSFSDLQKMETMYSMQFRKKHFSKEEIMKIHNSICYIERDVRGIPLSRKEKKEAKEGICISYLILAKYIKEKRKNADEYL